MIKLSLIIFYACIIFVLALIGWIVTRSKGMWAGIVIGVLLCVGLYIWGGNKYGKTHASGSDNLDYNSRWDNWTEGEHSARSGNAGCKIWDKKKGTGKVWGREYGCERDQHGCGAPEPEHGCGEHENGGDHWSGTNNISKYRKSGGYQNEEMI